MTDNLTYRAEQALIGAVLVDRRLLDDVGYLSYLDLSDATHQAVFKTIVDLGIQRPDLAGAALADSVAMTVQLPGVDAEYLGGLAMNCPDPEAIAIYGRMVQEAALRRDLAAHAEVLFEQAGEIRGVDPHLDHLAILADSLRLHGAAFDYASETHASETDASDSSAWLQATAREREVLADLLQHPELIAHTTWLEPEVFVSPNNRQIYEAILVIDDRGEPVEELTVAWELGRRRALADIQEGVTPEDAGRSGTGPTPAYVAMLAAAAIDYGAAITSGQELLVAHTRTTLAAEADRLSVRAGVGGTEQEVTGRAAQQGRSLSRGHLPAPVLLPPQPTLEQDGPQIKA